MNKYKYLRPKSIRVGDVIYDSQFGENMVRSIRKEQHGRDTVYWMNIGDFPDEDGKVYPLSLGYTEGRDQVARLRSK